MLLFVFLIDDEDKGAEHLRLASLCSFVQHLSGKAMNFP